MLLVFGSYDPYLADTVTTRRSAIVVAKTLAKSIRRKAHGLVAMYDMRKISIVVRLGVKIKANLHKIFYATCAAFGTAKT